MIEGFKDLRCVGIKGQRWKGLKQKGKKVNHVRRKKISGGKVWIRVFSCGLWVVGCGLCIEKGATKAAPFLTKPN